MLTRWDPFGDLSRMMGYGFGRSNDNQFVPACDVYEEKDAIVIRAEMPGAKAEDVHIDVENGVLTLRGERRLENEDKREGYHRIERSYGSFVRSFAIPSDVDPAQIDAELRDGMLCVRVPKKPEAEPRRINVRSSASTAAAIGGPGQNKAAEAPVAAGSQPQTKAAAGSADATAAGAPRQKENGGTQRAGAQQGQTGATAHR